MNNYAAAISVVLTADNRGEFFSIATPTAKNIFLKKVYLSGIADREAVQVTARKYSTLATGGTTIAINKVPLIASGIPADAQVLVYSVSPASGTNVGAIRNSHVKLDGSISEYDFSGVVVKNGEYIGLSLNNETLSGTIALTVLWEEV